MSNSETADEVLMIWVGPWEASPDPAELRRRRAEPWRHVVDDDTHDDLIDIVERMHNQTDAETDAAVCEMLRRRYAERTTTLRLARGRDYER